MSKISDLLFKHIIGSLSEEEKKELDIWIESHPENRKLAERLQNPEFLHDWYMKRVSVETERPLELMRRYTLASRVKMSMKKISVAASVVLVAGVAWFAVKNINLENREKSQDLVAQQMSFEDIRPGETKARLSVGNHRTVSLSAQDTAYSSVNLFSEDKFKSSQKIEQLCLDVPRGNEFKIKLEDSTEVWLNSESRLRYPASFASGERRVEIEGEAYFNVAHDSDRPFYVIADGQKIRVYGTTFNVRAYPEDEYVYTTLETGSIALTKENNPAGELFLSPGHQALFDKAECKVDMKVVDPAVITGWRHGRFVFEELPLKIIMRDLARWYNFEYRFEQSDLEDIIFMGSIPRYSDFSTAKRILERSGDIELSTDGNLVVISTKK